MKILKTLLIVDKDNSRRSILCGFFTADYNVLEATNGTEALKILEKEKNKVVAILLDITKPAMEEYDFLNRRMHDLDLLAIPVIVITECNMIDCESKALSLGATGIVYKPYNQNNVTLRVKNLLQKYQLDEMRVENEYIGELESTKNILNTLFEHINSGISIIELQGQSIVLNFANKKHLEMFGIYEENIEKADVLKNIHPLDLPNFIKAVKKVSKKSESIESTYRYNIEHNEEPSYFKTRISKIINPKSKNISLLCITSNETKNLKSIYGLEDSYKQMNAIFDSINGGIGIIDINDKISINYSNSGLFSMLGYPENDYEIIRKVLSPDEYNRILKYLQNAPIDEEISYPIKLVKRNFDDIYILIKGKIIESSENNNKMLVALFIDLTEEKKKEEQIRYLVEYDDLTKLFNQKKFCEVTELMVLKNLEKNHLLVLIDVFRFKSIKTILGRKASDELLIVIGEALKALIKFGTRGRIGNDIFAFCVLEENFDMDEFNKKMDEYIMTNFKKSNISLYYSIYSIDDPYLPIDTVILRTSYALLEIKGNVFRNYVYCDKDIRNRALIRDEIQIDMFEGLSKNQFEVFIQPVYDLVKREIIAAEALVRWNHPKRGYLFPSSFISVFEQNGFITNLDSFVWNEVAKLIKKWINSNMKVVPISINVSRVDLYDVEFYGKIVGIVEAHNIPPKYLRIEITESAYIINESIIKRTVERLKDYGFIVLMDDFGSGYSSLNSLKNISFDVLKLDMKLIKDVENNPRSANILKAIIEMANSLELPIIAEGVETETQVKFLTEYGCNSAQGYLFSKAVKIEEIEKMLNK